MYKIYINETPLYLVSKKDAEALGQEEGHNLLARYAGKPKLLLSYADMLEKGSDFDKVILYSNEIQTLVRDFFDHYIVVEAAGGLVFDEQKQLLMIFRRGHWDLPKGKIDEGETPELAAVREVQEETGIQQVEIERFFHKTYHFYRTRKQKRAIKLSHWFLMTATNQSLVPQTEEDIEKAIWMDLSDLPSLNGPIYGNIRDLIYKYQEI